MKHVTWIAHRGGIPENSRDAIYHSLVNPQIDGVEVDVRFSSDEWPMIHHDETLERLFHTPTFVSQSTKKELIETFHLLSLEELFDMWKKHSHKLLILEIKSCPSLNKMDRLRSMLCRQFFMDCHEHGTLQNLIIASFHESVVKNWTMCSTMMLCCNEFEIIPWSKQIGMVGLSSEVCSRSYVERIRSYHSPQPIRIFVFTINEPLLAFSLANESGCDGILSDDVVTLRETLFFEQC